MIDTPNGPDLGPNPGTGAGLGTDLGKGQQKPGRGLRIALAISVALNLAVVGLVAGVALKAGGAPPMPLRELGIGPFTEALTKEQRGELRRAYMRNAPDFRAVRQEMRQDATQVLAALRSDPFDAATFAATVERMNTRNAGRVALGTQAVQDLLIAMPAAERAAFADRLQAEMERGLRGQRGDDRSKPRD